MIQKTETLSLFHPLIATWFREHVGPPTEPQIQGWPVIAAGEHVLISAPTGSGKTMTAFLWAVNQWATGAWRPGHTSVLYVSPLKALNNDIRRNLLDPLRALHDIFAEQKAPFPRIRVMTRSGDTPAADRRAMQRRPPEILITTPESLNLLLSSLGGRSILKGIATVILDEIHEVLGSKRGVHLITAVDRLVPLSGEFQRIALSATMRPLEGAARFVGGFRLEGPPGNPRYHPRPVRVLVSKVPRPYEIQVRFPEKPDDFQDGESIWKPMVRSLKERISRNRSTLVFTNSRRFCEKLTLKINHGETHPVAYAHHGSLSREIRTEVEKKLKEGDLQAIVATNSLELGIDIGPLDEVVLIQSPKSISSAIQRVGRSGHQVGGVSRGTFFPTHSQDLLESAVLARSILRQDMEAVCPVDCPLDVLAQIIISMVGVEMWDMDALYAQLKTSTPFQNLTREQFDLVLNMLGGRFAGTRLRELKPRVSIDRLDHTVTARRGALLALYMSGGMIPDRGYFQLRYLETNALIGELDEEFVWEAKVGQIFTLGTQTWRIERITHNDVFVMPAPPRSMSAPFWKGEEMSRNFHFSMAIARFLEQANDRLEDPAFLDELERAYGMEKKAARHLVDYLKQQKERTGCDLPHRRHLLLEVVSTGPRSAPGNQVVLHTLWGGRVNRPFAMALDAAWEERYGHRLEVYAGDDCVVLLLPHEVRAEELLTLVTSSRLSSLLRKRLEGSGFFGARFRECAGRALLLTRRKFKERLPLWMNRLRSKKLLEAVLPYDDFPILLEAWRTCLQDEFDLDGLGQVLSELESGRITWSEARTSHPSPMARTLSWRQVNDYMYKGDEPFSGKASGLREDLLQGLVFDPGLRPSLDRAVKDRFESKRQRLSPGYAPASPRDLVDWVKERLLIPLPEWDRLLEAMERDHGGDAAAWPVLAGERLAEIHPEGAAQPLILAMERLPEISRAFCWGDAPPAFRAYPSEKPLPVRAAEEAEAEKENGEALLTMLLGEWLQFYGPVTIRDIRGALGLKEALLQEALEDLLQTEKVIRGRLLKDSEDEWICDSENFEHLLRLSRRGALPAFEPLPVEKLTLFLAARQGIVSPGPGREGIEGLKQSLERLLCHPLPARQWETEILPSRLSPYEPSRLDALIQQEGELRWIGMDKQQVAFCFESDLDLMQGDGGGSTKEGLSSQLNGRATDPLTDQGSPGDAECIPATGGRYDFSTLLRLKGLRPSALADRLWEGVWAGEITNDTFLALRRGIETRFQLPDEALDRREPQGRGKRGGGRRAFSRWKSAMPYAGNWFRLSWPELSDDLLEREEQNKDRVRLLLDRYGLLFRELLQRESPPFQWAGLFRSMRLMEFSGEILGGYFFHGIPGPQFISHQAFRSLQRNLPEEAIWWVHATDPASLCGVPLEGLQGTLPRRVEGTHLVYQGHRLIMVSRQRGKVLTFQIPPDDPAIQSALGPLHHQLRRPFQPLRRITIETINEEKAPKSPYADALSTAFDLTADAHRVTLRRKRTEI